jgi:DNA adenine methylase
MRLPLYIIKTAGTKSWFVPYALEFLGDWRPRTIVEPFAGSGIVGLSLLHEGRAERLVLAENDEDYAAFWRVALTDPGFSYRVAKWTKQVLSLPFDQQKPFVHAELERMKEQEPGFWILLRSRVGFNGKKKGGFMTDRHRGGMLARWPRTLDASLDLLYSMRNKITLMQDGFDALAAFDTPDCYAFVDPTYTMTDKCPGHVLYDKIFAEHARLLTMLANRKGPWQLTYNLCPATFALTARLRATRIDSDGREEVLWVKNGPLCGIPGLDDDFVQMTSGSGRGGSSKKWELVVSKRALPHDRWNMTAPEPEQILSASAA